MFRTKRTKYEFLFSSLSSKLKLMGRGVISFAAAKLVSEAGQRSEAITFSFSEVEEATPWVKHRSLYLSCRPQWGG